MRGRLEVRGRWSGVRGRRFVRPALILIAADGTQRRVLAELDDKPWAAQDGEAWRAAFLVDDVGAAAGLELTVAPDITVALRGSAGADSPAVSGAAVAKPAAVGMPTAQTTAQTTGGTPPRRARARADGDGRGESSRLAARLAAAEAALTEERARRAEADEALERQRSEARRTTTELGRARAELDLAHAAEHEAQQTAALLDASRRDHHAARARYEALSAEHDRALRTQAELREQLQEHSGALQVARDELATERGRHDDLRQRTARDERSWEERAARGQEAVAHRTAVTAAHTPPPPRSDRPLNPSLHSRNWLLRLLVVVVLAAFLLAVYLVLHSTVL